MSQRRSEQIEAMERTGVMSRRRDQLRAWFQTHPRGTAQQAIRELGYSRADHMYIVADSARIDLLRGQDAAEAAAQDSGQTRP